MEILHSIIKFTYNLLQYELSFPPFRFTIWQFDIAILIMALAIDFVIDIFNS